MPPESESTKTHHVSLRVDQQTYHYLEGLAEDWEMGRSEALRTIIKSHHGVMWGNFFGIVDNDKLADEWGDIGHLLAAANESDRGVPATLSEPRLVDVIEPLPILISAAEVEMGDMDAGRLDSEDDDAPSQ